MDQVTWTRLRESYANGAAKSWDEAPTPWRVVRSYSEISTVLDAMGNRLLTCSHGLCERVVRAVNAMEPGGRNPF